MGLQEGALEVEGRATVWRWHQGTCGHWGLGLVGSGWLWRIELTSRTAALEGFGVGEEQMRVGLGLGVSALLVRWGAGLTGPWRAACRAWAVAAHPRASFQRRPELSHAHQCTLSPGKGCSGCSVLCGLPGVTRMGRPAPVGHGGRTTAHSSRLPPSLFRQRSRE